MSNIAEVIGWKFDHQPGMRCKEIKGVIKIVEFPGGIPTQADQDIWIAEYEAVGIIEVARQNMYVERYQARSALYNAGLLDDVNTLMADPATNPLVVIAWEDAKIFKRLSPTVTLMGEALGLSDSQLDTLFHDAFLIEA